jgi:hypothetical protein
MDKFTVARLMGHSSPRVAERYYIHVTERHITTGFERFVTYLERQLVHAVMPFTKTVQEREVFHVSDCDGPWQRASEQKVGEVTFPKLDEFYGAFP